MKKRSLLYNVIAAILITAVFTVFPAKVQAEAAGVVSAQKEENIYASLGSDGSFMNAYVVNSFTLDRAGVIEDYGEYDSVRNLSSTDRLDVTNDRIRVSAPAGQFYYQGNIKKLELPWQFTVSYFLDEKKVKAEELSGADGHLLIRIKINKNPASRGSFYEHYAVQTSVTLDTDLSSGILAEGASIANAGSNKVITWTMLPGSEADYTISADVTDFHMDGIQFSAVPFSMDIEMPDTKVFTDKMFQLTEGIKDLDDGASGLKAGAEDLKKGAGELKDGMQALQPGIVGISEGLSMLEKQNASLAGGSQELLLGLTAIRDSLPDEMAQLKGALTQLTASFELFSSGLKAYTEGVAELSRNSSKVTEGYLALMNGAQSMYTGISEFSKGTGQFAGGIRQLRDGTASIDDEIEAAVAELMDSFTGGEFEPVSFISPKNKDVSAVQFILLTEGIDEPEPEMEVKEEVKKLTFWDRLLSLFGL